VQTGKEGAEQRRAGAIKIYTAEGCWRGYYKEELRGSRGMTPEIRAVMREIAGKERTELRPLSKR
jgi:hypothetical protein